MQNSIRSPQKAQTALPKPGHILITTYQLCNKVMWPNPPKSSWPKRQSVFNRSYVDPHILAFTMKLLLVSIGGRFLLSLILLGCIKIVCKTIKAVWLQTPPWTQSPPGHVVPELLQWQIVVQNQSPNKFWSNPFMCSPETQLLQETLPYWHTSVLGWMSLLMATLTAKTAEPSACLA